MMKITKTTLWFLFGMLLMLISCIEEFDVPNTTSPKFKSELVIQGRILSGEESTFYLSMTSAFGDNQGIRLLQPAVLRLRIQHAQQGLEERSLGNTVRLHHGDTAGQNFLRNAACHPSVCLGHTFCSESQCVCTGRGYFI